MTSEPQDIAAGQRVMAIPLRLAINDYVDDPDAACFGLSDAPWSVRLAAKLLREVAKGAASPWAAYLQVNFFVLHGCADGGGGSACG